MSKASYRSSLVLLIAGVVFVIVSNSYKEAYSLESTNEKTVVASAGLRISSTKADEPVVILKQVIKGAAPSSVSGNYLSLMDAAKVSPSGSLIFWNMEHAITGGTSGHRNSFQLNTTFSAADDGRTKNPYYQAFGPTMNVTSGDDGGSPDGKGPTYATGRGAFFVTNPVLKATNAPNLQELSVQENNVSCDQSCSVAYKSSLAIVPLSTDKTQGRQVDDLITLSAQPGAVGSKVLINVSASHGAVPFNGGSTILKAAGGRLLNGLDFSGLEITGQAFASPSFSVDGAGRLNASSIIESSPVVPTSSAAPCLKGQRSWDARFEYRCVAPNHWKRMALSDF